jgi:hypothetical protein
MAEIKRTFVRRYFDVLTSYIARLSRRAPQSFRDVLAASFTNGATQ